MADPAAGGCFLGLPVAKKIPKYRPSKFVYGRASLGTIFHKKMPQNNNNNKNPLKMWSYTFT